MNLLSDGGGNVFINRGDKVRYAFHAHALILVALALSAIIGSAKLFSDGEGIASAFVSRADLTKKPRGCGSVNLLSDGGGNVFINRGDKVRYAFHAHALVLVAVSRAGFTKVRNYFLTAKELPARLYPAQI